MLSAVLAVTGASAQTYRTTGLSTDWSDPSAWSCTGGGCKPIPSEKLNGGVEIIISHYIHYSGKSFAVNDGSITVRKGGELVLSPGVNISLREGNSINIYGGSLYMQSDGSFNLASGGTINLSKGYLSISGNFQNDGTFFFEDGCLSLPNGNFENRGELQGAGNVLVENGNAGNYGTWSAGIAYCVSGNASGAFPGAPSCEAVTEQCDCLREPCVIENPDILPGYDPTTRVEDIIGSELTALNTDPAGNANEDIFVLGGNNRVLIDIIYFEGQYANVVGILAGYGISESDFIDNGANSLVITVFFPIANLLELNAFTTEINFVRPTPPGRTNTESSLNNQGDFAQESFFARAGFGLSGAGIKVGVLSDSYDKSLGNQPAASDVASGVLPGQGNPNGLTQQVQVLQDYPFGPASDEGRGMMQIVHSVAPGADLAFHTAFISPGNFAQGIRALRDAGCDVIVDDVTYVTEPFFTNVSEGVVAQAVAEVTQQGVEYFTCAGNFASRGSEGIFTPGPPGADENKHHFAPGDFLQQLTLGVGDYLVVLQWEDDFYSIDGGAGAQNDFDFYLADDNGNPIYGFNRNNLGGDPIEVMPFKVVNPTTSNFLIERISGSGTPRFKYIVFKAGNSNQGFSAEYNPSGTATIIGHANSLNSMTVGAVRFENTPQFGGTLQTEAFSSTGDPMASLKPDFTAPNGGNITVDLGGGDYSGDPDNLPNFFGTSAAAPHAAGIAALLLESQSTFQTPFNIRAKLSSTAISYGEPASVMGAGFISAYDAMTSFANPSPQLLQLNIDNLTEGQEPGDVAFELIVEGEYFTDETTVYFRGDELAPVARTANSITVVIPPFLGNPPVWVQTPPMTNSGLDGGADTSYFSEPVITQVTIAAEEKTKKYGEALPAFTYTIDPPLPPEYEALLPEIAFSTEATDLTNVGQYAIIPSFDLAPGATLDPALQELYEFNFESGFLQIEKAGLTITPNDLTVGYGQALPPITFQYQLDENINIPNKAVIQNNLEAEHVASMADDIAVLRNISLANISLANISLANRAFITSYNSLQPGSISNISLANGMHIIEVDAQLFEDLDQWESGTDFISNISLANFISLANAQARINVGEINSPSELLNISLANISLANISLANISLANFISLANISLANISLANGEVVEDFSLPLRNFISLANNDNTGIVTILTQEDVDETGPIPLIPVNFITGLEVGEQKIVPAAFFSNELSQNFHVTYETGNLTITPAILTITAKDTFAMFGDPLPEFEYDVSGFIPGESFEDVFTGPDAISLTLDPPFSEPGVYAIIPTLNEQPENYLVETVNGNFYYNPEKGFKLQTYFDCIIDQGPNHPSGFDYIVRFTFRNRNDVPYFVPAGPDNTFDGPASYEGKPLELIEPGIGSFEIPFDGKRIRWVITTYGTTFKSDWVDKSRTRCDDTQALTGADPAASGRSLRQYQLFPNPVLDKLTIRLSPTGQPENTPARIEVYDIIGRLRQVQVVETVEGLQYEIDMSQLNHGIYFLKLKSAVEEKVFRIVKE